MDYTETALDLRRLATMETQFLKTKKQIRTLLPKPKQTRTKDLQ